MGYPLIKRLYAKDGLPPHKDIWTPKMGYLLIKMPVHQRWVTPSLRDLYTKDGLPLHKDICTPKMGYPLIKMPVYQRWVTPS